MSDPYVEANRALLLSRSETGLAKYGTDLTRADLSREQWIQHAIEEALDLANYLQRLKAVPLNARSLHDRISALLILAESPVPLDTELLLEVLREARQFFRAAGLLDVQTSLEVNRGR